MRSSIRFGISWRLSIITSLLVFLGFCTLGAGIFLSSQQQIKERLEKESRDSLTFATVSLTQPVWVFDFKALDQITTALVNQEQMTVVAIRILSNDAKTLIEKKSNKYKEENFENLQQLPSYVLYESSLTHDQQPIGKVQIIFSSQRSDEELFTLMKDMALLTAWMALIGAGVVFWVTRKFLAAPLQGLVNIAQRIEHGDYSIEPEKWKHEFFYLSRAFSNAASAIKKRDIELKMHAENLEKLVALRTKELDMQRMRLFQSSRLASLGEVSAGIAHEINNPLAVIQGNTEILSRYVEGNAKAQAHLDKIMAMVQRISKIIKGLRTFARDGSKDPMHTFQLVPFLDELKDLCQARIKSHDILLSIECAEHLQTYGREVQISQVLLNMINNSVDAIESLSEKWIQIQVFERNENLVLSITDSGQGIAENIREKIMEPFFTTKTIGKGTGLGLAISVGIVKDHGGDLVYVESSKHTRFEIVLPIFQERLEAA